MAAATLCELMDQLWHDLSQCDLDTDDDRQASHVVHSQICVKMAEHWPTGGFLTASGPVLLHVPGLAPYQWTVANPRIARWNRANSALKRLAFAADSVPA